MHTGQERDPLNHGLTLIPSPSPHSPHTGSLPGLASASLQQRCRHAGSEKLLGMLKMKTATLSTEHQKIREKI